MVTVTVMIVVEHLIYATGLSGMACLWHNEKFSLSDPIMMCRVLGLFSAPSLVIGLFGYTTDTVLPLAQRSLLDVTDRRAPQHLFFVGGSTKYILIAPE